VTIFDRGLKEQRAGFEGGGEQSAGIIAQVENQPGEPVAPQFFDGLLELPAGLLVEARDPYVADARADEEGALDAGGLHLLRRENQVLDAGRAGRNHFKLRLLLARLREEFGELIEIEPVDGVSVDGDNLVARRETGLGGWSAGQRLEHNHPPGQQRNHAAKALLRGRFHPLELLELPRIEENGVRIEPAQESGDGSLVEGLFGGDRIGGVLLHDGIRADDALHLRIEIVVRGQQGGGSAEHGGGEAHHQSGQISAIWIWTPGNCFGSRTP
jgi:hypothetical protein